MSEWIERLSERPGGLLERCDLICELFEAGSVQLPSLEWLLDRVERDERSRAWH